MFGTRSGGPHARADVFFFFFFALDGRARVCTTGGMDGTHGWMDDVYRGALGPVAVVSVLSLLGFVVCVVCMACSVSGLCVCMSRDSWVSRGCVLNPKP